LSYKTIQLLQVSCPRCQADVAVAEHETIERDGETEHESQLRCGDAVCTYEAFGFSDQTMDAAMVNALDSYRSLT